MKDLKATILKFALQNAVKFQGKASAGAVVGKVLAEHPELKKDMKSLMKDITAVLKDVNKMQVEEQEKQLQKLAPELLEKKKHEERTLRELPGAVMGKVVTRIPPEPSKYLHIGHALSFLINYLYAEKYQGKCVVRFEDTNPLTCTQEYVDAMQEDILHYLQIKPSAIHFASDDMEKFYRYAEQLIKEGKAYVCFCAREMMKDYRMKGKECACRSKKMQENMDAWKDMLQGEYDDGSCILRLKIDMNHKNMVMRDPALFRIITTEHYRQKKKYVVWPLYDFVNVIEDGLQGITHVMRSAEFGEVRIELQEYIRDLFQFQHAVVIQYGRFSVIGAITQGREIRKMIEERVVTGWDDPRLVTLQALKKRGIQRETLYQLAIDVGLSKTQTNIDWQLLAALNRKLLDPLAFRYFFVKDPVKITIEKAPQQEVLLDLHPDKKEGGRTFITHQEFFITQEDFNALLEGKLVRLMDCLNFVKKKGAFLFDSFEVEAFRKKGEKIIHWLPAEEKQVKVTVIMPDGGSVSGVGETRLQHLKENEIVQLERFGFCRLEKKEQGKLLFWYCHR